MPTDVEVALSASHLPSALSAPEARPNRYDVNSGPRHHERRWNGRVTGPRSCQRSMRPRQSRQAIAHWQSVSWAVTVR